MKYTKLNSEYLRRKCSLATFTFEELPSTNTLLKEYACQKAPEGAAIIAESQSAGRGRRGNSFFSPKGTGLYMSVLLRPKSQDFKPSYFTSAAAVAAAEAIEAVSDRIAEIKWVNDIYCSEKKVCGILSESGFCGDDRFVVIGAGFNVCTPVGGFPEEIRDRADSIFGEKAKRFSRENLAIEFYRRLMKYCYLPPAKIYTDYKERLLVLGRRVSYQDKEGVAVSIDREYRLEVHLDNGQIEFLDSGEISIKF